MEPRFHLLLDQIDCVATATVHEMFVPFGARFGCQMSPRDDFWNYPLHIASSNGALSHRAHVLVRGDSEPPALDTWQELGELFPP